MEHAGSVTEGPGCGLARCAAWAAACLRAPLLNRVCARRSAVCGVFAALRVPDLRLDVDAQKLCARHLLGQLVEARPHPTARSGAQNEGTRKEGDGMVEGGGRDRGVSVTESIRQPSYRGYRRVWGRVDLQNGEWNSTSVNWPVALQESSLCQYQTSCSGP
eukprot:1096891-Rhodomonas_salina.1